MIAAISGADSEVPDVPSSVMSGSERPAAPVADAVVRCHAGTPNSCETPPPDSGHRRSGCLRLPLSSSDRTVPPTAVT